MGTHKNNLFFIFDSDVLTFKLNSVAAITVVSAHKLFKSNIALLSE